MIELQKTISIFGNQVPRCQVIARSGKQCGQPAQANKPHCWNVAHHYVVEKSVVKDCLNTKSINKANADAKEFVSTVKDYLTVDKELSPEQQTKNTVIWGKMVAYVARMSRRKTGFE